MKSVQHPSRPGIAKFQTRPPGRLWQEVDAPTLISDDLAVWSDGHSTWPWRAKKAGIVLQANKRDRRFASSDAATAAAEHQWGMSR